LPWDEQIPEDTIEKLQNARVITMSAGWKKYLVDLGLSAERVTPVVGAADPALFQGHQRGSGKIGFCSAFYERKSPERVLNLVRAMPEHEFVLMGRKWEQFEHFDELIALPNFEYRQGSYAEYPAFYRDLDVFVSVSQLEGGPIPLLESMLSNVVPVATDTGFAPDVIDHGKNGFLFNANNGSTEEMVQLVRQALELQADIRQTALPYSWDCYAEQHIELFRSGCEIEQAKKIAA
ncbi:MAG: glycosyltransferase family 4 protein, partial [Planctomycetota bacterium]